MPILRVSPMYKLTGALIALLLNGCAIGHVHPWDRDLLAQDKMQLDAHKMESLMDQKIYFSREASRGGPGIGGGGCGCN